MGNILPSQIGEKLKKLREDHHLTQEETAKALGCTAKTYRAWEKNIYVPMGANLVALANLFDVDCDYLIDHIEEKTHDLDFACKYTGLSSESITTLQIYAESDIPDYFDRFILFCGYHAEEMNSNVSHAVSSQEEAVGNPTFNEQAYHNYAKISKRRGIKPSSSQPEVIQLPNGSVAMDASHAAQFYIDCATRHFREFLIEYVKTTAERKKRGVNNGEH